MPSDTFLETATILDLLKRPLPGVSQAQNSSRISLGDFVSAIKAWKECTSTSPSGRHLGHYKLLVKNMENKHAMPSVRVAATNILQLMVNIMDISVQQRVCSRLLDESDQCDDLQTAGRVPDAQTARHTLV
jgi:hypothetical protein